MGSENQSDSKILNNEILSKRAPKRVALLSVCLIATLVAICLRFTRAETSFLFSVHCLDRANPLSGIRFHGSNGSKLDATQPGTYTIDGSYFGGSGGDSDRYLLFGINGALTTFAHPVPTPLVRPRKKIGIEATPFKIEYEIQEVRAVSEAESLEYRKRCDSNSVFEFKDYARKTKTDIVLQEKWIKHSRMDSFSRLSINANGDVLGVVQQYLRIEDVPLRAPVLLVYSPSSAGGEFSGSVIYFALSTPENGERSKTDTVSIAKPNVEGTFIKVADGWLLVNGKSIFLGDSAADFGDRNSWAIIDGKTNYVGDVLRDGSRILGISPGEIKIEINGAISVISR
jgi:hypothetical protein